MYGCKYFNEYQTAGQDAFIKINQARFEIALEHERISILFSSLQGNPYQSHDFCILKFNTTPVSSIEIRSAHFQKELNEAFIKAGMAAPLKKKSKGWLYALIISSFIIIGGLAGLFIWGVPLLAKKLAKKIPVAQEQKLGTGMYESIIHQSKIDKEKTVWLNDFFKKLTLKSEYDIKITVISEDVTNAYAVPGGYIFVYSGILNKMNSFEELAALLSHEYSHIALKHSIQSMVENAGTSALLMGVIGDGGELSSALLQNAGQLKSLQFSRELEQEADMNGLLILKDSGIAPTGFEKLFKTLKKEQDIEVTEFLSSHPDLDKRIDYIKSSEEYKKIIAKPNPEMESIWQQIKNQKF